KAQALGDEALAQLDDARAAHGEEVVVEEHVPHPERRQPTAQGEDVVDPVESPAPAGGRAVAEGAGEGTSPRGDEARDGRVAVVEDVRLEAPRELRQETPGRLRQAVGRVAVEVGGPRGGAHAAVSATDEAGDAAGTLAVPQPLDQLRVRALTLPDDAVVE